MNFEDGVEGCCNTPGGELSGLTFGIRKFNVIGRGILYLIQLTIGSNLSVLSWKLFSIRVEKVSSRSESNHNPLIIIKAT